MKQIDIRPTNRADIPGLQAVLEETHLFPPDLLPDMVPQDPMASLDQLWLTAMRGPATLGFCFCDQEPMTQGTWNMRAIAVVPQHQGHGVGRQLIQAGEQTLKDRGARLLIVDTSGLGEFAQARGVYAACGYDEVARIRDFWDHGDDKVTFRKAL